MYPRFPFLLLLLISRNWLAKNSSSNNNNDGNIAFVINVVASWCQPSSVERDIKKEKKKKRKGGRDPM